MAGVPDSRRSCRRGSAQALMFGAQGIGNCVGTAALTLRCARTVPDGFHKGIDMLPHARQTGSHCNGYAIIRKAANEARSEEHTSELQSRGHLVCRLLLEKKK